MAAPNPPIDIIERAIIAVVAVLTANDDIKAITERADGNVTAWNASMLAALPVIAYSFTVATPGGGGTGDTREVMFLFTAVGATESVTNALLAVIENILWAPALAALPQPLNAYFRNPVRRPIPWDEDTDAYRSDLEFTLTVTK